MMGTDRDVARRVHLRGSKGLIRRSMAAVAAVGLSIALVVPALAAVPSTAPTGQPTTQPTGQPTTQPTGQPTEQPTAQPTEQPTAPPTATPKPSPTATPKPSGGGVEAATGTPRLTPPSTDAIVSTGSGGGGDGISVALLALVVLIGTTIALVPKRKAERNPVRRRR